MGKWLVRLLALIMVVRFGAPALVSATGATVFGVPWMTTGATAFLDSDVRFWGVLCICLGALLAILSFDVERHLTILDVIMLFTFAGGIVRVAEIVTGAALPPPALIATGVELIFPLAFFALTHSMRRDRRHQIERSTEVEAPKAKMFAVFSDYAEVHAWHPYMEKASLDEGSPESGIGAARTCEFGPRMAIRETVREWDDDGSMTIAIDFLRGIAPPIHDILASVRVEPLGPDRSRLVLTMSFKAKLGPLGGVLGELFVRPQYATVFHHMLRAAKVRAETGGTVEPIVMPMSGRQIAA